MTDETTATTGTGDYAEVNGINLTHDNLAMSPLFAAVTLDFLDHQADVG